MGKRVSPERAARLNSIAPQTFQRSGAGAIAITLNLMPSLTTPPYLSRQAKDFHNRGD
jgi:hypothetical protein